MVPMRTPERPGRRPRLGPSGFAASVIALPLGLQGTWTGRGFF